MSTRDELAEFLDAIWGDGLHSLCWRNDGFRYTLCDTPADLIARLDELLVFDVWVSAHPLRRAARGRGDRDTITQVAALSADLDWQHPTRRTDKPLPTESEVRSAMRRLGRH